MANIVTTSDSKILVSILVLLLFLVISIKAGADTWAFPSRSETPSTSGTFLFSIVPSRDFGESSIGPLGVLKKKTKDVYKTVWISKLINRRSPVSAVVSDDGSLVVTFDNYHSMGYGDDVIVFYDRNGSLIKQYSLEDVISVKQIEQLPRSVSSIWWRCGDPEIKNNSLYIGINNKMLPEGCEYYKLNPISNEIASVTKDEPVPDTESATVSSPMSMTVLSGDRDEMYKKYEEELKKAPPIIQAIRKGMNDYSEDEDYQGKIIEDIRHLIEQGEDINAVDKRGNSALYSANYLPKVAMYLVQNGASPKLNKDKWDNPFSHAVIGDHLELIETMLASGWDIKDYLVNENNAMEDVLTFSSNRVLRFLLDNGVDPNKKAGKYIPLNEALESHNWDAVGMLLDSGAKAQGLAEEHRLLLAVFQNDVRTAKKLLKKVKHKEDEELPQTAITLAAQKNYAKMVSMLIDGGVSPNSKYGIWETLPIIEASLANNLDVVEVLLENGADVNATDSYGFSSLDIANYFNLKEISRFLVNNGGIEKMEISRINTSVDE